MREGAAYIILLLCLLAIGLIPISSNNTAKIKYCHIDSTFVLANTEFIPEVMHKYKTDCGLVFSSKKEYRLGDSIQIKTIIVE